MLQKVEPMEYKWSRLSSDSIKSLMAYMLWNEWEQQSGWEIFIG